MLFRSYPTKADLILLAYSGKKQFDDTNLNFTGFHLTRKNLDYLPDQYSISAVNSNVTLDANEQAVPAPTSGGGYLYAFIAVYDGFQEGRLDYGLSPFDGTRYSTNHLTHNVGKKIQFDLSIKYGFQLATPVSLFAPVANSTSDQDYVIFDRRVTAIRIYMAEDKQTSSSGYEPASEWRFVKQVDVDATAWSGSGPAYTQTVYVTGSEWNANAGIDITDRQGHTSLRIHANASFVASAKKREAVANVNADEKRQSFVFFSPINSDELNTPNVIPHISFVDLSLYGIPKILGFIEALGFYIAIGENQLVKIDASALTVDKNIQARGVSSSNAVVNANGLIYFCNLEDIYYYHPAQDVIRSIATGFIREAWRALTTTNKQAAAIGYDKRYEILVVAAGSTIYTYNLPAAYASDLASDTQAIGSWQIYSVSTTFLSFYTDLTGRCIGIANDGIAYELFSPGVANTMTYEKVLGESNLNLHTLRLTYEATATVTASIFDLTKSSAYPLRSFSFPAQSTHKRYDQHKGAQAKRPLLRISAPVGTKISEIVVNPDPLTDLR